MDKKHLAMALSKLIPLETKHIHLEQYQTDSELASLLLWQAYLAGDITGKTVADFGCGNGIFGIGALLLGASNVYFIDQDPNAIAIAQNNAQGKGEFLCDDIITFQTPVDTVLMNPPFGVQQRKADKHFLEHAMHFSTAIYSIHKIESKHFLQSLCSDHRWRVTHITEHPFLLKKSYSFHTKKIHPVRIGIFELRV